METNKLKDYKEKQEFNQLGNRLRWIRTTLGITLSELTKNTGICKNTCATREYGALPKSLEDYELLANFFNDRWKDKFRGPNYPSYKGVVVSGIDEDFIMFGRLKDTTAIDELKATIAELEFKHRQRENELLRQIEVLSVKI